MKWKTIKKEWLAALVLLLLIPVVLRLGGVLFSLINPEIAAGHPNYVRNYHLLNLLRLSMMWGSGLVVLVLWVLVCLLVIRAKKRSAAWLVLAVLGPLGLAILAMLNDRETTNDRETLNGPKETDGRATANGGEAVETDRYSRLVRKMHWLVRAGYEVCSLFIVWELAWEGMILKRAVMIRLEAARTGMTVAQVIDLHDASGGMWAFSEGLEVMFFMVLLYLLRPLLFNLVARVVATTRPSPKAS